MARSSNFIDLTGATFGRLTVVELSLTTNRTGSTEWKCLCQCGKEKIAASVNLRRGAVTSCGCAQRERMKNNPPAKKHGMSSSPTYQSWAAMIRRCRDTGSKDYQHYGGRGIQVYPKWVESFELFLTHVGERPEGMTLDRKEKNGHYWPGNVEWATQETQMNNTNRNHLLTYNGETKSMAQWAKQLDIPYSRLRARINLLKWSVEKALGRKETS